jgi:hypothetical protein
MYGCVCVCVCGCVCVINKKKVLTNTRIQLQNRMRVKNRKFVCLPHLLGDGIGGFVLTTEDNKIHAVVGRRHMYNFHCHIMIEKTSTYIDR